MGQLVLIISGAHGWWSESAGKKTPLPPELVSHERGQLTISNLRVLPRLEDPRLAASGSRAR